LLDGTLQPVKLTCRRSLPVRQTNMMLIFQM
jgi:hypothetical protein